MSDRSIEQMTTALFGTLQGDYGLGVELGDLQGHPKFGHGGKFGGFNSALAHYPDNDLTIAVLANGPLAAHVLEREIAAAVLGVDVQRYD